MHSPGNLCLEVFQVDVHQARLQELLSGNRQYVVTVFQREYAWRRPQWETLWADLEESTGGNGKSPGHFMGAVVTLSQAQPLGRVPTYLLIDGQQRLTTLCILLAALRDCAQVQGNTGLAQRIDGLYLRNQFASGVECWKVLSTHTADREAFLSIMEHTTNSASSPVSDAYDFFTSAFAGVTDLEAWESAIVTDLGFVTISVDPDDNPHRIFESLNAKSVRLKQSDLLRNYFFMRLPPNEHEDLYSNLWEPMAASLPGAALDDFIRDYLVKDGQFVRGEDVYRTYKKRLEVLDVDQVGSELVELASFSAYYATFLQPSREADHGIRLRLENLSRWGGTTAYPFLLNVWNDEHQSECTKGDLAEVLWLIESFLVRRLFANVPTNELNRLFIRLYQQLGPERDYYVTRVWVALSRSGLRWPGNEEFMAGILKYPLYTDSRAEQRRFILETLEREYGHKEQVNLAGLTIEHLMPQTLTAWWREHLGSDAERVHKEMGHTLGNLTLTAYNPELSNWSFHEKRRLLAESHLDMNKEIALNEKWTEHEISTRAGTLSERAIKIWPGPLLLPLQTPVPSRPRTSDLTPSPSSPPLSRSGWTLLTDLMPIPKDNPEHPKRLLLPDGSEQPLASWKDLLTTVAQWLCDQGRLQAAHCPIPWREQSRSRYLVNISPKYSNEISFSVPVQVGGTLWLEAYGNSKTLVDNSRYLIAHLGDNPANFMVMF